MRGYKIIKYLNFRTYFFFLVKPVKLSILEVRLTVKILINIIKAMIYLVTVFSEISSIQNDFDLPTLLNRFSKHHLEVGSNN